MMEFETLTNPTSTYYQIKREFDNCYEPDKLKMIASVKEKIDSYNKEEKELDYIASHRGYEHRKYLENLIWTITDEVYDEQIRYYIIEDIIPGNSIGEIYGKSDTYKSFLILDMMWCICNGLPYHGHQVEKGNVVYVPGEGEPGLVMRTEALSEKYHSNHCLSFYQLRPFDLLDVERMQKAAQSLVAIGDVKLLVIDTLNSNTPSINENSASDWAQARKMMNKYLKPYVDTIIWIHHTGKDGKDSRGTNARFASADFVYKTQLGKQKREVALVNMKMKDTERIKPLHFKMINFSDSLVPQMMSSYKNSLTDTEQKVLEAIDKYDDTLSSKEFANIVFQIIDPFDEKNVDTKRKHKNRIKKKLLEHGLLPIILE